jgi:aryl-phospho-beta-D-glucosidase BglC (GH1 family)
LRGAGLILLLVIVGLTIVAYLPAGSLAASVPPPHYGDASLTWLRVSHGQIVDGSGRKVLLRGFNVDALVSYPHSPPAPLDEMDATLMQRAGFDVVRLGIDWAQLEPERGRVDRTYLERVATTVDMLNRHGLYVVLDMHFRLGWSPHFGYSGAPGWATLPVPNWNPLPQYSWSPSLSPAAFTSDTYFWLSSDWKKDFFSTWQTVATRFKDSPGVAGYDIFNEAHPLPIPPRIFEKSYLWPMFKDAIEAIGAVDSNHLYFVEGILLLSLDTVVIQLKAPNLVYGTHFYEGSLVPPSFAGDPAFLRSRFQQRVREAAELPAPLWIGELGYDLTLKTAGAYADVVLDVADDYGTGWAWWQWRENQFWGIVDAGGQIVNMNALRHLARPYVIAAPGGVHPTRGNGIQGTLTLRVDRSHADQPVEIGWSALTLAGPVVTGTCVNSSHWDATTGRLTLKLDPGMGCQVSLRAAA